MSSAPEEGRRTEGSTTWGPAGGSRDSRTGHGASRAPSQIWAPGSSEELTLRPLASLEEYLACTDLQEEVWGHGFSEKVSAAILMIANRLGGLAAGAFDEGGGLQGFVFGLTGIIDGKPVHWSDMLAVREAWRDRGLGTRLKGYQRDVLLGRGIREMRWTFDPLQGRNAHVNFSKLGIVSREYVENMYGDTDSPLHQGIGTDRLVAIWELSSERVKERLGRRKTGPGLSAPPEAREILPVGKEGALPEPGEPVLGLEDPHLLLAVPPVIDVIMARDMALAVRWREATRGAFLHYFSRGYEAREFLRAEAASAYLLVDPGNEDSGGNEAGQGRRAEGGVDP